MSHIKCNKLNTYGKRIIFAVFLGMFLNSCSNKSVREGLKQEIESAVHRPTVLFSGKGVPDGSIIIDGDVYEVEESPAWIDKIDKNRKLLRSKKEAIGRIARSGLTTGDFVYADQLSLPTKPKKGEKWLFSYPNSVLKKYVGKKITLKGELFPGVDRSFRILSYDSTGRVIVLGEIPKELAFQAQCVLASGELKRVPAVKNAPFLLYGFDAKKLTISPAKW